jgi:hypothetical protein
MSLRASLSCKPYIISLPSRRRPPTCRRRRPAASLARLHYLKPETRRLLRRRFNNCRPLTRVLGWAHLPRPMADKDIGNEGVQILGGYDQSQCARYDAASEFKGFQFESWIPENNLGPKTWIAIALPVQSKVVLKLWDGEEAETVRPLPICTCDRFGESTSLRCS